MALRRGVGSGLVAALLGGTLALTSSVSSVDATAVGDPIELPVPDQVENPILWTAGGDKVAGVDMSTGDLVVWDFSGSDPTVIELGVPEGSGGFPSAVNDSWAAGETFDEESVSQSVVWSLSDPTNPIPLGVPSGWASVSPTALDGNRLVGTGVDGSGQPHAVAWNLPDATPVDLGFISGKLVVEVNAVSGTWAVGMIADRVEESEPFPGFIFRTNVNPRPVVWDLTATPPSPILLPALVLDGQTHENGSAAAIVTGKDGIHVALGNITMPFGGTNAVAWKLGGTPSGPVTLNVSSGVATRVDKASGSRVLGAYISDVVAWDLSAWDGIAPAPTGVTLGSLDDAQYSIVNSVVDNRAVGTIYLADSSRPVVWDLSSTNPAPIELTRPDGDAYGSAFTIASDYIIGSSSSAPPGPTPSPTRIIAWRLSDLDGGGGVTTYTVTVTKPTNGTITGSGINCGSGGTTCSITVDPGSEVTLTATPDDGKVFTSWGGSCFGSTTTCTLTVTTSRAVTGSFGATRALTINPPTNARISSATGSLSCGNGFSACSTSVVDGTVVQLFISVNDLYALDEWTGCDSVTEGVCTVTIDNDSTIGASLSTLGRLAIAPSGGRITSSDGNLDCSLTGVCSFDYEPGTQVTLTTSSRDGLGFLGWTGATCNEGRTGLTCTVTITELTTTRMRANWEQLQRVAVVPSPNGTVTSSDGRFNCGVDQTVCEVFYRPNPTVTLTATPKPGFLFTGWAPTGGCVRAGMSPTCTVNRWTLYSAEATFAEAVQLTVTRRSDGTISSSNGKIKCGTVSTLCSALVPKGGNVVLTAIPDSGNELGIWMHRLGQSGGCQYTDKCYLVVDDDLTFEGMEFRKPATLTLQAPANGKVFQWWVQSGFESTALDCGLGQWKCAETYMVTALQGQQVHLEAKAAPGWFFSEWVGCESVRNTCVTYVSKNSTVTAKFVQASKLTVPQDTGGLVTSTDRRIKCGPGFLNCSFTYQGAPRVNLQAAPLPNIPMGDRMIVVEWKGCSINSWAGWAADNWTATSTGCSLTPGADSRVSPVMSRLTDVTSRILIRSVVPPATRQIIQNAATQIQAGTNCATNLETFIRELTLLNRRGGVSVADGLILVSGAKALCPNSAIAQVRR